MSNVVGLNQNELFHGLSYKYYALIFLEININNLSKS